MDLVGEQTALARAPLSVALAQRQIKRVRSDNGVGESERIAAVARPGVFFGGGHHARPSRVECDVASASDEVAVGFDNR